MSSSAESAPRRQRAVVTVAAAVGLLVLARGAVARAATDSAAPHAGGGVSGPPAPAVPAIAATPAPAAEPALPNAPREPGVAAREEGAVEPPAPVVKARAIKLWPLFDYESDPAAQTSRLRILGPLFEYRADAEHVSLALHPLVSIKQARVGHDDEVRVLYPLLSSRWEPRDQTTEGLGGLVSYHTTTSEDGRSLESQRMRLYPAYAYDWNAPATYGRFSVAPFYVDVDDVGGYDRVQMVMFPAYLRLEKTFADRRWYLFPFVGTVGGKLGEGWSVWPAYGWYREGAGAEGGFVAWPFYVWDMRRVPDGVERRTTSFPFSSTLTSPTRERTSYAAFLYTHDVDRTAGTETTGFPWPLWTVERDLESQRRTALRLFPFYQAYDEDGRHVASLFPLWREELVGDHDSGSMPALADGLFPRSAAVREDWAPLTELYAWDDPRWSVGWYWLTHEEHTTPPWWVGRP